MKAFTPPKGSDYMHHLCFHCGEWCTGKYCNFCKTADGRRKVDEQNKKIHEDNSIKATTAVSV